MDSRKTRVDSVDMYIASFPEEIRTKLEELRGTIKAAAPEAEEKISYQMPTYFFRGNLVHFAAHKNHIGFYPTPEGIEEFKEAISAYQWAKGSVQFPLDQPLPLDLVSQIVKFRLQQNMARAEAKGKRK